MSIFDKIFNQDTAARLQNNSAFLTSVEEDAINYVAFRPTKNFQANIPSLIMFVVCSTLKRRSDDVSDVELQYAIGGLYSELNRTTIAYSQLCSTTTVKAK